VLVGERKGGLVERASACPWVGDPRQVAATLWLNHDVRLPSPTQPY